MSKLKVLGQISSVKFGYGGYQNSQFGLEVSITGDGWGVGDFKGGWSLDIECTEHCKWTEEDRDKEYAETMRRLNEILKKAKVKDIADLKGIPVEVTWNEPGGAGSTLKSWRVLTEVL